MNKTQVVVKKEECTVGGHRVKVILVKNEVCGYVDGSQVYGVYVDDPDRLRVSTATAPTGEYAKSQAYVKCMSMVCDVVEEIVADLKRSSKPTAMKGVYIQQDEMQRPLTKADLDLMNKINRVAQHAFRGAGKRRVTQLAPKI